MDFDPAPEVHIHAEERLSVVQFNAYDSEEHREEEYR